MTAIRQKYYFGGEASWALGGPSSPHGSAAGGLTSPLEIITEARDGVSMTAPPSGNSASYLTAQSKGKQ
jgi:hypothetical protein